jgi:hypothetical protein
MKMKAELNGACRAQRAIVSALVLTTASGYLETRLS